MGKNNPCRGVLASVELIAELGSESFTQLKELLLRERFSHGSAFEKLHASEIIFSIRLNQKSRLLLTKHELEGQCYWVLLELLENHQYDRSKFLKKGYLNTYFSQESTMAGLHASLKAQGLDSVSSSSSPPTTSTSSHSTVEESKEDTIHYRELHFFNQELIILNEAQEAVLHMTEPMFVTGMPGSGKSCVALAYLSSCLNNLSDSKLSESFAPLLYVTESKLLSESMQNTFRSSPFGKTSLLSERIHFLSYHDLALKEYPELKEHKQVGKADFSTWFEHSRDSKIVRLKSSFGLKTHELVYQELRMMSAMDESSYQAISERESPLFNMTGNGSSTTGSLRSEKKTTISDEKTQRRADIYGIYKLYCTHLTHQHAYDLSFLALSRGSKYSHIAVDEAQDFSTLQLFNLHQLTAKNIHHEPCIAYFGDSNQSITDNFPKQNFFKTFLRIKRMGELPGTFRCSNAVLNVANQVLNIKYHLTRGTLEKGVQAFITKQSGISDGMSYLLDENPEKQAEETRKHIAALIKTTQCAIITPEEETVNAQKRFIGAIVLTPKQAKGLEYSHIILYRMLNRPFYRQMNLLLEDYEEDEPSVTKTMHRAKSDDAHYEYNAPLNELFTAITRAHESLFILETTDKNAVHYFRYFFEAIKNALPKVPSIAPAIPVPVTSITDWTKEIERQLNNGNRTVALDIAKNHLELTKQQFDEKFPVPTSLPVETKDEKRTSAATSPIPAQPKSVIPAQAGTSATVSVADFKSLLDVADKEIYSKLISFFNQEGAGVQLFQMNTGRGFSLFETWHMSLSNHTKLKILYSILKNPKFAEKITIEQLCCIHFTYRPIYILSESSQGISLLSSLLKNKPDLEKSDLFYDALFAPFEDVNILFWLCATPNGLPLLSKLIETHPDLMKDKRFITALCLPRSAKAGVDGNTSGLYWLCRTLDGRPLFSKLIETHPDLVKDKTFITALCRSVIAGIHENISGLHWLCAMSNGLAPLSKLIKAHPDVIKDKIFITALCLPSPSGSSGLFWLCEKSDSQALLATLIEGHPDLIKDKTFITALCLPRPATAGIYENTSGLHWLCSSPEKRVLLYKLIEIHPDLVKDKTFITALCLPRTAAANGDENISGLLYLCGNRQDPPLLSKLIEIHPDLMIDEAFIRSLYLPRRSAAAKMFQNTSGLYWLCENINNGILSKLIDSILIKRPDLIINEVFIAALCQPRPAAAGIYANTSGLFWLCARSPESRALLSKIIDSILITRPHLILNEAFIAALCLPRSSGDTGLILLCGTHDGGRALLFKLIECNPTLMINEELTRALFRPLGYGLYKNKTGISFLRENPDSQLFLQKYSSLLKIDFKYRERPMKEKVKSSLGLSTGHGLFVKSGESKTAPADTSPARATMIASGQ